MGSQEETTKMIRAVRSAVAALGLTTCLAVATTAWAQETEENDTVKKVDKTTQQGKITAEDLKGIKIQPAGTKATISLDWKSIKSIDYVGVGASNLRQA